MENHAVEKFPIKAKLLKYVFNLLGYLEIFEDNNNKLIK